MPAGHRGARAMKHPTELATAIEEAEQQARRAYELNDRSLPKTPQHCVGGGLFQHALDIADATIILVKKELPGPALALARPLIESWLRGVWAAKCAEDQEIKDFRAKGQPKPWKLPDLAEYVKERVPTEREYLEEVIESREVRKMLNDLTHGGRLQVQYREGNEAIEPRVPVEMQVGLLELGNQIRQKSVSYLREMMGEEGPAEQRSDEP